MPSIHQYHRTEKSPDSGVKETPRGITTGCLIFLADGEGFEPPVELPPQRFSRPPHSTALPPIRNYFYRRSFNLRFCSLFTPIGAAHHSFFLDFALLVSQTRMQDRRYCPALPPIQNFLTNLRFTIYYAFSFRKAFIRFFITEFTNKLIPIKNIINDNS